MDPLPGEPGGGCAFQTDKTHKRKSPRSGGSLRLFRLRKVQKLLPEKDRSHAVVKVKIIPKLPLMG